MLNQTVLVGRITKTPELVETETGKKMVNLTLAVPRSYKNEKGEYDADFIDCTLWQGIAQTTTDYCKKGDLVGIKGHLQTNTLKIDGKSQHRTKVIAEKVTFLSSAKERTL